MADSSGREAAPDPYEFADDADANNDVADEWLLTPPARKATT